MTDPHTNSSKKAARQPKTPLTKNFNKRSRKASEVELKFLVTDKDRDIYATIEKYFMDRDWIRLARKNSHLLTRQLDTPDRALLQNGHTLRIRGGCIDDRLDKIQQSDICVKTGKTQEKSGALTRGEYEARTRSFNSTDLSRLKKKYPKEEHPELHEALKGLKARDLQEYFRIDCYRDRYIIEVPEDVTGLKNKRFVAELIMDDVAYVVDIPGLEMPLIFYHDLEVECETLFKPCDYDQHPDKDKYVSSPMSEAEADQALDAMKYHIQKAAKNTLKPNKYSKAERGFYELEPAMEALRDFITARSPQSTAPADKKKTSLSSAFVLVAKNAQGTQSPDSPHKNGADRKPAALHKHLPRPMGYVLRQRAIALGKR